MMFKGIALEKYFILHSNDLLVYLIMIVNENFGIIIYLTIDSKMKEASEVFNSE